MVDDAGVGQWDQIIVSHVGAARNDAAQVVGGRHPGHSHPRAHVVGAARAPHVLRGRRVVRAGGGRRGGARVPEEGVLEVQEVAGLGARLIHLSHDADVVALPLVGDEQTRPRQRIPRLGEQRGLEEAAHLVPMGQRLRGRRGQPHRHDGADEGDVEPEGQAVHQA